MCCSSQRDLHWLHWTSTEAVLLHGSLEVSRDTFTNRLPGCLTV